MERTGRTADARHGAILKVLPRRSAARSSAAGVPPRPRLQIEDALLEGIERARSDDGVAGTPA